MTMKPDFSKYTYFELLDALKSVDREAYPERVLEINNELINVAEKMKNLGFRLPFHGIPSDGFLDNDGRPKNLWQKFKSAISFNDEPIKFYGNIEACVASGSDGSYNLSSVAAYMIEDKGFLNLVLRGEHYNNNHDVYSEARIKVNASNISRLKAILAQAEADIEARKSI